MATKDNSSWLEEFERSQLVRTGLRAIVSATALLLIYYYAPIPKHPHALVAPHIIACLLLFSVVLAFEVRQITSSDHPMLRATVAMSVVIPLFLVMFAWLYLVISQTSVAAFGMHLSRSAALYFTITVFSTVGFGDITAKSDPARLIVSTQMLADLVVIAVVARLILGAASRAQQRKRDQSED
jgi:voltage-gated potassium channel